MELAQLTWQRARELVDPVEHDDGFALVLELLRTARHDPATLAHARTLGWTYLRGQSDDAAGFAGVRMLERAIAFLGVRPSTGDVAPAWRRR